MADYSIGGIKIRIGADTKTLTSDLARASKTLQTSARSMKSIGADLSTSISLPLVGIGVAALKTFGDLEALQKGLIAVMGSSTAASKEFEKLREVAKLPGLGLEEAVKGSVALQAAGFSADQAREALLSFGNALATVGKGKAELDLVVLALTQMNNKSSGFGQEIRQLTEQLPQLRGALQAAFGTSESERIANMGYTGRQVVEILTKEFGKLPLVMGGFRNAMENAGDAIKIALAKAGEAINKNLNIEGLINRVAGAITKMIDRFSALDPSVQKIIIGIAAFATAIGPVIYAVGLMQGAFASVIGLVARLVSISALSAGGMVAAFNPVTVAIIGLGAAVGLLILHWDDMTAAYTKMNKESETFRVVIQSLEDTFQGLYVIVESLLDVLGDFLQQFVLLGRAALGEISFADALDQSGKEFEASGRKFGRNFIRVFKEEVDKGLIAGSTQNGERAARYAELRKKPVSNLTPSGAAGKKSNLQQYSELPFDVPLTSSFYRLDTGAANSVAAIDPKPIKFMDTMIEKMDEVQAKMRDTFQQTFETSVDFAARQLEKISEKYSKQAEILAQVGQIANAVFGAIGNIFAGQSQALDEKQKAERAYVEANVKNEDLKAKRLAAIDAKYDNERKKIARKNAIAQKVAGIFTATISMFEGIARTLALGPAGLPLLPYIKALGIANIAAVAAAPLPSLAIGTDRVNRSGLANIHKGEAIVPADVVSGGFSGYGNNRIEVVGRVHGMDIVLSNKNTEDLYSRIYG